jgi:hypothetical protein
MSETFEQFVARVNSANFRFAVGNPASGYSTTWTAFGNRGDYYIGSRVFMGSQKISLHASGICRVALTNKQHDALLEDGLDQPADRAMTKWRRPKTPDVGAVHVASILFPTDYLKLTEEPKGTHKKPLFIFDAAPAGQAVEMGFFYSREDQAAMEERYLRIGHPIVCTTLESGEHVTAIARITEFDRSLLPSQEIMDKTPGNILSKEVLEIKDSLPNLTASFWNAPGDGGTLKLIEVGGIVLKRNQG